MAKPGSHTHKRGTPAQDNASIRNSRAYAGALPSTPELARRPCQPPIPAANFEALAKGHGGIDRCLRKPDNKNRTTWREKHADGVCIAVHYWL